MPTLLSAPNFSGPGCEFCQAFTNWQLSTWFHADGAPTPVDVLGYGFADVRHYETLRLLLSKKLESAIALLKCSGVAFAGITLSDDLILSLKFQDTCAGKST